MTQKELAALCGCTQATVSKALRGVNTISADVREKILQTAAEHGMLHSRRKEPTGNIVLVLTPEYRSEFFGNLLSCLSSSLWEHGLNILSTTYEYDESNLGRLSKIVRSIHGLYGVIICLNANTDAELNQLIEDGIPVVRFGTGNIVDGVYPERLRSIRNAVEHLFSNHRRCIAYIGEKNTLIKEFCFRQVMAELGIPADNRYIHRSALRFAQAGAEGFEKLMGLDEPPDAIICSYDYIAFGVLNAAFAAGIDVPHDLAVIGMDDISSTGIYRLGLTTIGMDYRKLSETLVELLIRRVRDPDAPQMCLTADNPLIVRETG